MKNVALINCLYPNKCAGCGEIIDENRTFCDYCKKKIDKVRAVNFCDKCGCHKDNCLCKNREFHFKGIAGVYKNEGVAKTAYYSYKLQRRQGLSDFFAGEVAKVVNKNFANLKFDAICAVPTAYRSRLKRGFDHSKEIAIRVAEILDIEYVGDVLKVHHFKRSQHKSLFSQRLENVLDKYYTVKKIGKKRILLFDDIYTTGATLDECAKELMFAGAREVYCVSVLTTALKKKTDGVK